ncbi:hypothetical protein [Rothia nasimurium]|uniref:hypothetical protein n=1 Tax=Rothia nasimurium TaxID=85336 RepID=UPI003BA3250B
MVRKRSTEKTADDFIEAAEKDASWKQEETSPAASKMTAKTQTVEMPAETKDRVKARARASLKRGIYTIQATESQKELMNYAAEQLDISKAKLMERYFFTALEEEFGADVPITKEV